MKSYMPIVIDSAIFMMAVILILKHEYTAGVLALLLREAIYSNRKSTPRKGK